jgi:hypothetical protein
VYQYLLRRFLMPAFAEVPLGWLDVLAVRGWLARLHRDGEVTPTTIAKAYRLLRRILAVAAEAGYLPRNPCTVKGAGVERVREMRHVTVPELLRLAGLVPDRYRAMVLLAGFGGLRWGPAGMAAGGRPGWRDYGSMIYGTRRRRLPQQPGPPQGS